MTPKEKAEELVDKFKTFTHSTSEWGEYDERVETQMACNCAKIAADECLKLMLNECSEDTEVVKFWMDVKKEIDLL